jgi:hypothetical protein
MRRFRLRTMREGYTSRGGVWEFVLQCLSDLYALSAVRVKLVSSISISVRPCRSCHAGVQDSVGLAVAEDPTSKSSSSLFSA